MERVPELLCSTVEFCHGRCGHGDPYWTAKLPSPPSTFDKSILRPIFSCFRGAMSKVGLFSGLVILMACIGYCHAECSPFIDCCTYNCTEAKVGTCSDDPGNFGDLVRVVMLF